MIWKAATLILVLLPLLGLAALRCTSTPSDVIPDLAYVECDAGAYSNDADPEPDVIGIWILFRDTKSELIGFRGVPCRVTFELNVALQKEGEKPLEVVYEGQFTIDRSYGMGMSVDEPYEIPIDDFAPGEWDACGVDISKATIETPEQGVFTCE